MNQELTNRETPFEQALAVETTNWMTELDQALSHTDESAIWRIMDAQAQNEEAHEALANMVSRLAYEYKGVPVFSEIFMMPVLAEPGASIMGVDAAWKTAGDRIRESLGEWFNKGYRTTIFDGIQPMDWVTTWTPAVLRNHLTTMIPGSGPTRPEFETETVELPADAPRLGFVMIGLSRNRAWPELPEANTLRDNRFKDIVRYSLQLSAPVPSGYRVATPTVLTPERVQYAITDGVCLWLNRLNETVGITGWMVAPSRTTRDVVKVTLKLSSNEVEYTQFTLRLHQIGMQGLNEVVIMLSSFAQSLDIPFDVKEETYRKSSHQVNATH